MKTADSTTATTKPKSAMTPVTDSKPATKPAAEPATKTNAAQLNVYSESEPFEGTW